jgi:hypothetical protein
MEQERTYAWVFIIFERNRNEVCLLLRFSSSAVVIRPSDSWGGVGVAGLSIRLLDIDAATEYVWHVLEVYQNSPASAAGLESYADYIVGSPDVVFGSYDDFYAYIRNAYSSNASVPLYIYSKKTNKVRLVSHNGNFSNTQVSMRPSREWGGEGILGCNIGSGYIHQIPLVTGHKDERGSV